MRILDLGAHDGFVGTWLASELDGLHIDGVEANSDGVRIANERASKHDIAGEYKQGLAEDAPLLFEEGTYDVVVSYEVIEHVPDVDRFLGACEQMCRPGGRVYLSTPNGTFGEGNNPHHLRVYRAVDLFELCRRRGRVMDMVAGNDGVSVISYVPAEYDDCTKPELAIYCGPGWEKWHPADIGSKGLGGSETAAVRLAEALSELYTVTVYAECDFCAWRQVQFKPHGCFNPTERRDTVVYSRRPDAADWPTNSRRKLLWMHDTEYGATDEQMAAFDAVMVLSEWHASHVSELYPELRNIVQTGNAIEPRYFGDSLTERPHTALYSSSPDRGLDKILKLWPKVREQVPDAELHFCYASVYQKIADQNPMVGAFRKQIDELADQPGVRNLGSLTQKQLAEAMETVQCWLAPSWNTPTEQPFMETYCIGALEAAAGGAVVIASGWGALTERVEDAVNSILIPEFDEEEWVSAIVNGMTMCTPEPSLSALETTWAKRASEFDRVIQAHALSTTTG